jgi:hypothetical protein
MSLIYFRWQRGSAIHVSIVLEKDDASRSADNHQFPFIFLTAFFSDTIILAVYGAAG